MKIFDYANKTIFYFCCWVVIFYNAVMFLFKFAVEKLEFMPQHSTDVIVTESNNIIFLGLRGIVVRTIDLAKRTNLILTLEFAFTTIFVMMGLLLLMQTYFKIIGRRPIPYRRMFENFLKRLEEENNRRKREEEERNK